MSRRCSNVLLFFSEWQFGDASSRGGELCHPSRTRTREKIQDHRWTKRHMDSEDAS